MKGNQREEIPDFPWDAKKLQLIVGWKEGQAIFQNTIVSGTTATGKTTRVMYPLLKQALNHQAKKPDAKAGMLVLDVKGNFYVKVVEYAESCGRMDDVILIKPDGEYRYNPLHKPGMKAEDLAERSLTVMGLFNSETRKEAFWDTQAIKMMTECIRLLRCCLGYCTLGDIHRLLTDKQFLEDMLKLLDLQYAQSNTPISGSDYQACITYFTGEFNSKEDDFIEIVKVEITKMTALFATSERIARSFCPPREKLNFPGFETTIREGKVVVLAMNMAEYLWASCMIAAYLKLDFQTEIQQRTLPGSYLNSTRPMFFICDEYQTVVTKNDGDFFSLSQEARCCSVVATPSYTSLLKSLNDDWPAFETLLQNLTNKIALRTDDRLTIEIMQQLTSQ